jgi:hypothetical protein
VKDQSEKYIKYDSEDGEHYYCPMAVSAAHLTGDHIDSECVEASTAGRYSGNIDVIERFKA